MRIKAHIYLNGLLGTPQDFFSFEPYFDSAYLRSKLDENSGAEDLIIHINSQGGDVNEAFTMHDMLVNSGKTITTEIEGVCASAATIPALAGKVRKMTKYSTFMIHEPYGKREGTAEELQKAADEMQRVQDKIAQFYSDKIGKPADTFSEWMAEEKYMSADEALDLGFITEVVEPAKAVATIKTKSSHQSPNTILMDFKNEINKMIADIKNSLGMTPKALDLTDATGIVVRVDTTKAEAAVGDPLTIDNKPVADGEYIIPAMNKIIVAVAGKITEIKDSATTQTDPAAGAQNQETAEIKALKDQITARDAQINELTTKVNTQETEMKTILENVKMINNHIVSGGFKAEGRTQNFDKNKTEGASNDTDDKVKLAKEKRLEREAKQKEKAK